ncbi:MAG TPA: DUF167 domain-containing protein [Candidatus Baltobacteraceae bacterium]|nr:DUF167 domain-containing protein [Candidatus Baltobacteraceae bacterium]
MPVRLQIAAKPGSRTPAVTVRNGIVNVAVRERALGGAANAAIVRAVAAWLGVAPSRIALVHGTRARRKVLAIEGMDAAALAQRLAEPL